MPTKKQIKEQLDSFIVEALRLEMGPYPNRKIQGLIYSLGYLEGVLIDAIYELPIYSQKEILSRFEKDHLHQVIIKKRKKTGA